MKLFVFGGSGLIGRAVTRAAVTGGHRVMALARSEDGGGVIRGLGAMPVRGDMTEPASWREAVARSDIVVQVAAAFGEDPAGAEAIWTDAMIDLSLARETPLRLVYTGGCWLFPAQTDPPITESTAFDPLPPFRYMVDHRARLLDAGIDVTTIHPAVVWSETDGCIASLAGPMLRGERVRIVGSTDVRWPLVHADDLAALYMLACYDAASRQDFLGVTDASVSLAQIVAALEAETGASGALDIVSVEEAVRETGDWAAGLARSQNIQTDLARRMLGWRPTRPFLPRPEHPSRHRRQLAWRLAKDELPRREYTGRST
jgi:nucleoside-diphosphate-sugar epimerase